jgi:hypothetical protein
MVNQAGSPLSAPIAELPAGIANSSGRPRTLDRSKSWLRRWRRRRRGWGSRWTTPAPETPYRLITTILDPEVAPATELAARYSQRREIETALHELKTHQRGPQPCAAFAVTRRSRAGSVTTSAGPRHPLPHARHRPRSRRRPRPAILHPEHPPASASRADSDRAGGLPPHRLADATADGFREIAARLLPARRRRSNPRIVKRKMSGFRVKRDEHRNGPQPTRDQADTLRHWPS